MKRIPYVRDGAVLFFENIEAVPLKYGAWTLNARWMVIEDVFKSVQQQNPDVEFVEGEKKSKQPSCFL